MKSSESKPSSDLAQELKELENLENDPVWSLLDDASHQEPSPTFAQNIMAEIRNADTDIQDIPNNIISPPSFWKRHSTKIATATAAIAACVIVAINTSSPATGDNIASNPTTLTPSGNDETSALEQPIVDTQDDIDALVEEMLRIDNEDPFFMSADDIEILVAM